jgi:hypothetical protein
MLQAKHETWHHIQFLGIVHNNAPKPHPTREMLALSYTVYAFCTYTSLRLYVK